MGRRGLLSSRPVLLSAVSPSFTAICTFPFLFADSFCSSPSYSPSRLLVFSPTFLSFLLLFLNVSPSSPRHPFTSPHSRHHFLATTLTTFLSFSPCIFSVRLTANCVPDHHLFRPFVFPLAQKSPTKSTCQPFQSLFFCSSRRLFLFLASLPCHLHRIFNN